MKGKNKIVYLILGIGIGIIVTNILNSAYPKIEYVELSEEKIIKEASELGMVKIKENIDTKKTKIEKKNEENKDIEINEEDPVEIGENISREIVIESGSNLTGVTKDLYEKKLIDDEEDFIYFVRDSGLEKKLNVGTYNIEDGSNYSEIIEKLTHRSHNYTK